MTANSVKLPADVELADRLAFGLTGKQLGILAATVVTGYGGYLLLHTVLPTPLALAPLVLIAVAGGMLALARHDGLSGDQLAVAVGRHLLAPKRQLLAPGGLPLPLPGSPAQASCSPLDIPVKRVLANGLVEIADGGHRLLLTAAGTSFALRSELEQEAFVACFRRFLDARADPVQLSVLSEPATLGPHADRVEQAARSAPPGMRDAAIDHARYLRALADQGDLRRRRIVVVLASRERDPELAAVGLTRVAAESSDLLAGAGVTLDVLDGDRAAVLLARSLESSGSVAGSHSNGIIRAKHARVAGRSDLVDQVLVIPPKS